MVELPGKTHHSTVYIKRNEAYEEKDTVPTVQSSMVEVLRYFGDVLLLLALGALILWHNVGPSVRKLYLHQRLLMFCIINPFNYCHFLHLIHLCVIILKGFLTIGNL